jgi:hypothetical protein
MLPTKIASASVDGPNDSAVTFFNPTSISFLSHTKLQ